MQAYSDIQDIEDNFDYEEQLDSIRYQVQETEQFKSSTLELRRNNPSLTNIQSQGGQNSLYKLQPQKLHFSNTTSVRTSHQLDETKQQYKKQQLQNQQHQQHQPHQQHQQKQQNQQHQQHNQQQQHQQYQQQSQQKYQQKNSNQMYKYNITTIQKSAQIEEQNTDQEQSVDAMKKVNMNKKLNLTIATDGEDDTQNAQLSSEEMEYFMMTLIQEIEKQQLEIERLHVISERQKITNNKQLQTNKDMCDILDDTQHQMMVLAKENQVLKKKCTLSDKQQISTFLTADSENNSRGKENYPINKRKLLLY